MGTQPEGLRCGALHGQLAYAACGSMVGLATGKSHRKQCYVAGVNRVGTDASCEYCGGTLMIDPYGRTVAACGQGWVDAVTVE